MLLLVLLVMLPLPSSAGRRADPPAGTGGAIVSDLDTLSVGEREELAARRAAVQARAAELGRHLGAPCADLRAVVLEGLGTVARVGAVDPGPAVLTSHPPRFRVRYVVALTSGRLVWDETIVTVPLEARVVPLREPTDGRASPCQGGRPRR